MGHRLTKFQPKALEGIFVGYGVESHTYRIYDKASVIVVDSCSVVFEENDGSQVGQVDVCADDEIPQDAIGRVGVELLHPIEGHLVADWEELCSTQVEPSSSQTQHIPAAGANDGPIQRQAENPQQVDQAVILRADNPAPTGGLSDPMGPPAQQEDDVSPCRDQDQHSDDAAQSNDQGQANGQDGDQNDQAIPPRSKLRLVARQECKEL